MTDCAQHARAALDGCRDQDRERDASCSIESFEWIVEVQRRSTSHPDGDVSDVDRGQYEKCTR
jgi:hypothetical protein